MIDALSIAGWTAGWLVAGRVHRLPDAPARARRTPRVSVVVPARDEAARLPRLLAALAADPHHGSADELIVVDDGSTDDTASLAAAAGATVVAVEPPEGWTGKAWACWRGAEVATGDVVVFLDADTEPGPGFVARLAAAASASGGVVSVQPTHEVRRTYERASATCNAVALTAGTGALAGRGRWWRGPVAFGPALAAPRLAYLDAGGHGLVRAEVAEDLAIARAFDRAGMQVAAYADAGEGALRYRMYPEGPGSLVEGWTKNLAAGAGAVPPLRAGLVAVWLTGALHAALVVVALPAAYVLFAAQCAVLFRRAGRFGVLTALLYPLPVLAFVALFARSSVRRLTRRSVSWRGRTVPT
jgi:4,4'-diaponeurosporenoate glycosyltransferase